MDTDTVIAGAENNQEPTTVETDTDTTLSISDVPLPAQIFDVAETNEFVRNRLDYFKEMHKTTKNNCIRK